MLKHRTRFTAPKLCAALLALALLTGLPAWSEPAEHIAYVATDGSDASGDGTPESPYATIAHAAMARPGSVIEVRGGDYGPVVLGPECSGSAASPTVIRAAEGEAAVVHGEGGEGISIRNARHLTLEGLEVAGGTHGIDCRSTREAGNRPLEGIVLRGCRVHGIRGVHGICVYAHNDLAPIAGLVIENCEIYDCECGSSESLVINGNVDGFLIAGNVIHDNDNIGIDMIGFEGTAKRPDGADGNPFAVDFVRNGVCRDNVVYGISAEGNPAYLEDGEYDLCADGIYVDGGQDIEICNNFIFHCDIGLEVATEHSPKDNELFRVTGIDVHDNVIAGCQGWTGLCFGGYDGDRGFTEGCAFHHNTLADNVTQIAVQRSRDNRVYANLLLGGETAVELSEDCDPEDTVNDISGNAAAGVEDEDSWAEDYGAMYADRSAAADGLRSLLDGVGSRFLPDEAWLEAWDAIRACF